MVAGIVRPKSRGRIRLTGPTPFDPVQIETNVMSHPDDLKAGNTMAPCVIIGERAGEILKADHKLSTKPSRLDQTARRQKKEWIAMDTHTTAARG